MEPDYNELISLPALLADLLVDYEFPDTASAAAEARRRASYQNQWKGAVTGAFPTVRIGRGLYVRRADRPEAARFIGLRPRAAALSAA